MCGLNYLKEEVMKMSIQSKKHPHEDELRKRRFEVENQLKTRVGERNGFVVEWDESL